MCLTVQHWLSAACPLSACDGLSVRLEQIRPFRVRRRVTDTPRLNPCMCSLDSHPALRSTPPTVRSLRLSFSARCLSPAPDAACPQCRLPLPSPARALCVWRWRREPGWCRCWPLARRCRCGGGRKGSGCSSTPARPLSRSPRPPFARPTLQPRRPCSCSWQTSSPRPSCSGPPTSAWASPCHSSWLAGGGGRSL